MPRVRQVIASWSTVGLALVVGLGSLEPNALARTSPASTPSETAVSPSDRAIDPALPGAVPWRVRPPPRAPGTTRPRAREARTPARGEEPEAPEPRRGIGMLITGAAMIAPAGVATIGLGWALRGFSAAGFCAHCEPSTSEGGGLTGIGLFVVGGASIVAGIGLLVVGSERLARWRAWRRTHPTLAPTLQRSSAGGWRAGFTLRF